MTLKPLQDRVVVQRVEAEESTKSGILLAASAKEKPQIAEVVAVGPGARAEDGTLIPVDVTVGQKVITSKYSGTEIKLDGNPMEGYDPDIYNYTVNIVYDGIEYTIPAYEFVVIKK